MRDFNHTIGVLVKAYLNNTLIHQDCAACAVGNIIADSLGAKISDREGMKQKYWKRGNDWLEPIWGNVFMTPSPLSKQIRNPDRYRGMMKKQIDASGYTWQELARIEKAFESQFCGFDCDESMFDGLMAVVDVLADIHGIDLTTREETKKLFVKETID